MRYLIEETTNGKFLVRYSNFQDLPEHMMLSEETKGIVDILLVSETNILSHVREDEIENEFGVNVMALKCIIGECLSRENFPVGQWIQVNILNVM